MHDFHSINNAMTLISGWYVANTICMEVKAPNEMVQWRRVEWMEWMDKFELFEKIKKKNKKTNVLIGTVCNELLAFFYFIQYCSFVCCFFQWFGYNYLVIFVFSNASLLYIFIFVFYFCCCCWLSSYWILNLCLCFSNERSINNGVLKIYKLLKLKRRPLDWRFFFFFLQIGFYIIIN